MKKGPNSRRRDDRRYTLPRTDILRGRRNFRRLFQRSRVLKSPTIHLRYRLYDQPEEGFYVGFVVGKRLGNAVKRNKIKRWLREAYRTHQHLLTEHFDHHSFGFHGVFMAMTPETSFQKVETDMILLLEKARNILSKLDMKKTPGRSKNK